MRANAGPDRWLLSCRRAGELPCEVLVASRPEPPSALARTVHLLVAGLGLLTLAGLAFAVFTATNLLPRALATHRWYRKRFPDYPSSRRAIIPFLV